MHKEFLFCKIICCCACTARRHGSQDRLRPNMPSRPSNAASGQVRVEALAAQLGVSRQHLALQFRQHVGIGPKLFARICRFRAASAGMQSLAGQPDWAQVALQFGYFDQSHLIRDFQDFAHSSPEAWLAGQRA